MHALRQPLRSLARQPGFTATVVLTCALGIGTATAVYSLVYAILLRPFPYRDPDGLVRVQTRYTKQGDTLQGCSLLDIDDYRGRATSLEDIGAYTAFENRITGDGPSQVAVISQLNPSALSILGVQPVLGRLFTPDDDRPGGDVHKALISHSLWEARFGSDRSVVGQALHTDRATYTIVGVMPPDSRTPAVGVLDADGSWYATQLGDRAVKRRSQRFYATVARLKPGVSPMQAEADLNAVAEGLEREYPTNNDGVRIKLTPLREFETGSLRPYLRTTRGRGGAPFS